MGKQILPTSLPSQEIPEFYRTKKFISVHKTLPLGPILSQMNPVDILPYCLRRFNILAIPRSSKVAVSFMFPYAKLWPFTNFINM